MTIQQRSSRFILRISFHLVAPEIYDELNMSITLILFPIYRWCDTLCLGITMCIMTHHRDLSQTETVASEAATLTVTYAGLYTQLIFDKLG